MKILITGGCGSLGRAFIEFLRKNNELTVCDFAEWSIAECRHLYPDVKFILDDYSNLTGKFDVLIALAAAKHVDLGETNIEWFIENNVNKLTKLYSNVKAGQILFASTDKSVEPISLYGYTKSIGEKLTKSYDGTVFRMGNVMGSSGSTIAVWEAAIEKGEPLPVTDPMMKRYMIPADEAVQKIMELLPHAKPGQVIIPEMGKPIGMTTLVNRVYRKHGISEAKIKIIGIRPGEKLEEKLKWDHEKTVYSDINGEIVE